MGVLREYHAAMGALILGHEGTLERFTGDGMMVFFNDPVPVPDPPERAVRMALAMRERRRRARRVSGSKRGHDLDFGIGIAQGYATLGAIGFEGRLDYGAIGTVTNLAARLCGEAKAGQILVSQRLLGAVEGLAEAESVGELSLKGFSKPVPAFNVVGLKAPGCERRRPRVTRHATSASCRSRDAPCDGDPIGVGTPPLTGHEWVVRVRLTLPERARPVHSLSSPRNRNRPATARRNGAAEDLRPRRTRARIARARPPAGECRHGARRS